MMQRALGYVVVLITLLGWVPEAWALPSLPTPPATFNATMPDTTGYNVYGPFAASSLQTHINNVGTTAGGHATSDLTNGVILKVTAGTSTGTLSLPNKAMAAGKWILIRPDDLALAALPTSGTRVAPANASSMWQMAVPNNSDGITTSNNANSFRIIGLEIHPANSDPLNFVNTLINIGQGIATAGQSPQNIVIDRCYIHGNAGAQNVRNGVTLYAKSSAVVDSFIDNIWLSGAESHIIFFNDTMGPILIQNNQISNSSIGILAGGVSSTFDQGTPYDVTVRRNYFFKDTAYRNSSYFVKNHLEYKRGTRLRVEQNFMFQLWSEFGDQNGSAMQLTVRVEGSDLNARINDVEVGWNLIRGADSGINAVGVDNSNHQSETAARLYVHDNLLDDINRSSWFGSAGGRGFIAAFSGYNDLTIDHNTVIHAGADNSMGYLAVGLSDQMPQFTMSGFTFTNNVSQERDEAFWSDGEGTGNVTTLLNKYFAGGNRFTNNVLAPGTQAGFPAGQRTISTSTFTGVSYFTSFAGRNYKLLPGVTGQGQGVNFSNASDGTDIGISNYDTFIAKTSGVQAGLPEGPSVSVALAGIGSGTITSSVGGINCPGTCSATYASGTPVTLTATATPPSTFTGWSGGGCAGTGTCLVTVTSPTSVTATFTAPSFTLSVVKAGSGASVGSVSSGPAGISCGADCSEPYATGTMVTLSETPGSGNTFTGWSGGGCSGTGTTCVVTVTSATAVTASFQGPLLTVTTAGTGSGTVTTSPAGVSCPGDCTENFAPSQSVTLTATPAGGSTFAGWSGSGGSGCLSGTTNPCTFSMGTAAKTRTATFNTSTVTLTVNKAGTGSGTVTSSPAGINCGATCGPVSFALNTVVTLTAAPAGGSAFTGWSGGGCSGTGTCVVTLSVATTVTATFAPTFTLTVSITGPGSSSGTVTSSPAGISCPGTCAFSFGSGTLVTLTATPGSNGTFTGWSGSGCAGTGTCQVTMSAARSVTASFDFLFTDASLAGTTIKAVHISELRTAVDNLRAQQGLGVFSYVDPVLTSVTPKAVHITQLRAALDAVYTARSLGLPVYTDPVLAAGATIQAVHITQLRAAVNAL